METNPQRVLTATAALLTKHLEDPRQYTLVVELKAQALFHLEDFDGCIRYVNSLPQDLQNIQGVMMVKAKALKANGHFIEALSLFQALYERDPVHFNDKKTTALALAEHLQSMGGVADRRAAQNIYTRLRTQAAGGQENVPCNDEDIELALAELALIKHLNTIAGVDNKRASLEIYTRRLRANETEDLEGVIAGLSGIGFQPIGGTDHERASLEASTRLRDLTARGVMSTHQAKEIELGIANILIDMGEWRLFDELQLDAQPFPEFETCLCISRRNLQELTETEGFGPERLALLGKALHWASLAVEQTGGTNALCLRQLGHCLCLVSSWPKSGLQTLGIEEKKEHEFSERSALLFAKANELISHL
ncbi:hypothetical protein, partial [Sansalvadorimonas verongulae]|uniref:hypothetical protein n=1 Tax=Sansalvadorimonas verongulae TaxID=2172824 RepID=UPI0018AD1D93